MSHSDASKSSQHVPSVPAAQAVHHESRNASNSAGYLLPTLHALASSGSRPNLTLLDVGAGSGTISVTLAQAVAPCGGTVVATDVNPGILPRAQAIADAAGVTNLTFQQADALSLPFPDGSFDVVHCHQVLTHIKAPWDALREMVRVAKPGGVVAAREGDMVTEAVWPPLPGLLRFHDLAAAAMRSYGGSNTAGRELLSWALKAGVERERIGYSVGTWSYSSKEERQVWARGMRQQLQEGRLRTAGLEKGLATEADMEEMDKAWEEWEERDDAMLAMMSGEILIQK
ncbi:S-adenosyl-L-methionine-dependent methyltransferase [Mycena rosella]|uniref:S-adenosyl-L-methionine-dependent methyltransferase n=1 Tax=Mycena rosella TaxID=1033263 RepID=A0AAD7MBM7_MYCRO|nr:S-adenosyl-L-methionine-dependent methyltransferase [Mycena rosella]